MDPISAIASLVTSVVSRIWPDKSQADREAFTLEITRELNATNLLTKQMETNSAEAANPNRTWITWRELLGYVCVVAFAWQYVALPVLLFTCAAFGHQISVPSLDMASMMTILLGMLGIGLQKTYEKVKGF